jgi:hypothetical protein
MRRYHPVITESSKTQRKIMKHGGDPISREEIRWLEGARPRLRGDCEPCPSCQQDRDAALARIGSLVCGHTPAQQVCHSRPCMFLACRYHLSAEVTPYGSIRVMAEDLEAEKETCALDVADRGVHTLEYVGEILHITRERTRQIEEASYRKVRESPGALTRNLREHAEP